MGHLGRVWDYSDSLKKGPEDVINTDLLNELVEQTITPVEQCHCLGIYMRRKRIITALLKDMLKVKYKRCKRGESIKRSKVKSGESILKKRIKFSFVKVSRRR